jgi:hypothetical protein
MTQLRVDELLSEAYAKTLGVLVANLSEALPEALVSKLCEAVEKRNYLAHYFWFEQLHLISTSEGAYKLVEQLSAYAEEFHSIDGEIQNLARGCLSRLGITDEMLAETLREASHEPIEPLHQQRRLKKEELVIAIYQVPIPEGGTTLVFETDDHVLWQLCDIGLGWTHFDRVGPDWQEPELFRSILPARVRPRVETAVPWQYDIGIGIKAVLVVRPSHDRNTFNYRLKLVKKAQ